MARNELRRGKQEGKQKEEEEQRKGAIIEETMSI